MKRLITLIIVLFFIFICIQMSKAASPDRPKSCKQKIKEIKKQQRKVKKMHYVRLKR